MLRFRLFWKVYGEHIEDAVLALVIGGLIATLIIYVIMLIANGPPYHLTTCPR